MKKKKKKIEKKKKKKANSQNNDTEFDDEFEFVAQVLNLDNHFTQMNLHCVTM